MASRSRCPSATGRGTSSGPPARSPSGTAYSSANRRIPGPRHLRIGFKTPITVGSVLVRGNGQVSMLRPTAPYPGDLADESQWVPAEQSRGRRPPIPRRPTSNTCFGFSPRRPATRALRFTHTAEPVDSRFAGWLGGAYVLCPTDGQRGARGNRHDRRQRRGRRARSTTRTITACGPHGTTARKAARSRSRGSIRSMSCWPGGSRWRSAASARCGPALPPPTCRPIAAPPTGRRARPPRPTGGPSAHWEGIENQYPRGLGVNWLDLGQTLTTRAIRLADHAGHQGRPSAPRGKDQERPAGLARRIARPAPAGRCAAGSGLFATAALPLSMGRSPCDSRSMRRAT